MLAMFLACSLRDEALELVLTKALELLLTHVQAGICGSALQVLHACMLTAI